MGLFGRLGCSAGACHGSFQGKGGFRLSLFGYDPARDYAALTRDTLGRRISPVDPSSSLILLKATTQIGHGGGKRFARDSWQYRLFREWIAAGAHWRKGHGDVAELTVTPAEFATIQPGAVGRVSVRARFADGSTEDVTPLCDIRTQDDAVAEVPAPGTVKALRPGDTALVISYRGNVRAIRVLVPMPVEGDFRYPRVPEASYIDREVFAKLRRLNMVPSELADDGEFLRRVTIDTIGCLPSADEARAFLKDQSADKRAKKIDALLAHPLHAALWATKLSDITGNNTNALAVKGKGGPLQARYSQMWHDWLRKRVQENVPYDEIVHGVLCATSRDGQEPQSWLREARAIDEAAQSGFVSSYAGRSSLDLFWRMGKQLPLEQLGERTAAAFLGIRLECAQCHKHPFDRWTQADYRAYANIFGQVMVGISPETQNVLYDGKPPPPPAKGKKAVPEVIEVYISPNKVRSLPHPDYVPVIKKIIVNKNGKKLVETDPPRPLPPRALGGPEIRIEKSKDARATLFEWMRSPSNPYFARSFVNRVWGHYFGVGLVDPVDNLSLANPPSNARLLDALADDFVKHRLDIRRLERTVLNSRVYQLSSTMNATNKLDRNNYAHSYLRPLMAEVAVDVLGSALGIRPNFGPDAPPDRHAIEIGASRVFNGSLAYAFGVFGRPSRTSVCDCERAAEPALPQTLYLMTDPDVLAMLRAAAQPLPVPKDKKGKGDPQPVPVKGKGKPVPVPVKGKGKPQVAPVKGMGKGAPLLPPQEGRLAKLLRSNLTEEQILDELFLATLTRYPSAAERQYFVAYRAMRKAAAPDPNETPKQKKLRASTARTEREAVFIDALWALINTREFIVNH
jgi:hypothetical protein